MRCPGCGLYHPPQYEQCVSCGADLGTDVPGDEVPAEATRSTATADRPPAADTAAPQPLRRSKQTKHPRQSRIPTLVGIGTALAILLVSAGATFFFLTKPADDERLYKEAQRQLANGQYAFAVKSLEQAAALRPNDARVYLALARAYVGIDQIDKAWESIGQAQQLGTGVASDPGLASELANYYRQRKQYDKAIELLRPLAQAEVPGKKAELADLSALCGDEALRDGNLELALRSWEEVRDLREGTRFGEADSRLATIYQKMAGKLMSDRNDDQALAYLAKLNTIAENASNYEKAAEIYERRGQLELAIDQLRRASRLISKSPTVEKRLASLMARRGKELLDAGDTAAGYGYLQQARALDPLNVLPSVTLRNIEVGLLPGARLPRITGEVWNPGPSPIRFLTLKVELWNAAQSKSLWEREQKLIDEFVPPLAVEESRPFDMMASVPVRDEAKTELRVYIDGGLYKSYPLGQKTETAAAGTEAADVDASTDEPGRVAPRAPQAVPTSSMPPPAPAIRRSDSLPPPLAPGAEEPEPATEHPESRTLNDLDL